MKPVLCLALLLAAVPAAIPVTASTTVSADRTVVNDPAMLARLRRNSGVTLQWISFESETRGHVRVSDANGFVHLTGSQRNGEASVELDGDVLRIERDRFVFRGRIAIHNTPDPGRVCLREGEFEFRITQNRRYWRLQQMEQCDGLTDYVDIYF